MAAHNLLDKCVVCRNSSPQMGANGQNMQVGDGRRRELNWWESRHGKRQTTYDASLDSHHEYL